MKIVVLEGVSSSGKSSCVETLKEHYVTQGKAVEVLTLDLNEDVSNDQCFPIMNDHVRFFINLAKLQSMEQAINKLKYDRKTDVVLIDGFLDSVFVHSKFLKIQKVKKKSYTKILYKYYYASIKPDITLYCVATNKTILARLLEKKAKFKKHSVEYSQELFMELFSKTTEDTSNVSRKYVVMCDDTVDKLKHNLIDLIKKLEDKHDKNKK